MRSLLIVLALAGVTMEAMADDLVIRLNGSLYRATPLVVVDVTTNDVVPGPITPGPVVPGDLSAAVSAAVAAVPDYAAKETDAASIAFTINVVVPYLKGDGNVSQINRTVKTMANSSLSDASQWESFWAVVEAKTSGMTIAQYKSALTTVAESLTGDMAASGELFAGQETYGLDIANLVKIIEFIFKYLPLILELLS